DGVLALRREADVRHDWDARGRHRGDLWRAHLAALQLHRVAATLLHEPHGGPQRLGRALLVRTERHVTDDESALGRPDYRADQWEQLLDRSRQARFVAKHVVGC